MLPAFARALISIADHQASDAPVDTSMLKFSNSETCFNSRLYCQFVRCRVDRLIDRAMASQEAESARHRVVKDLLLQASSAEQKARRELRPNRWHCWVCGRAHCGRARAARNQGHCLAVWLPGQLHVFVVALLFAASWLRSLSLGRHLCVAAGHLRMVLGRGQSEVWSLRWRSSGQRLLTRRFGSSCSMAT